MEPTPVQSIRPAVTRERTTFGSRGRRTAWVLAALAIAWTVGPLAADDPPATNATPWERLTDAVTQYTQGTNQSAEEALGSAIFETAEQPEPLDSASVSVTEAGLLEVHVRDAEITAVLEMLSYQAHSNIVATRSVKGTVSANLYGRTLIETLDAILTPNQYGYRQTNGTIFVGTPAEIAAQGPPPETRILKLRYITKGEALTAVGEVISEGGSVVAGGGSGSSGGTSQEDATEAAEAGSDYLIVTDTPDRLEKVARILKHIDVRPRQVLIEATILRATLNEANDFGIDFTLLGGMDFQNVSSISPASTDIVTGLTPPTKFEQTTFNVNTDLLGNFADGGFTFGIVKNGVAGFIRALEEVTDVTVVANPKIIALNKQQGEVIVGRRDGYLTTTVTETAAVQTVEFLETGTQIKFRPFINDDGTVRLTVHPKDSNGGLTSANLPFEETTEAHADIIIDDGHTILIGGLFRERTVSSRGQVPVLGDIPVLGLLFQNRSDQTVREEVIILLTVHVLKNTDQERDSHAALLEDVERIRVGGRLGLLGTGRERLAQAFYQEAIRQVEDGRLDRALLNVRLALHNYPKHVTALKLKERLLGRRMWDSDGSRNRAFLLNLIQREKMSPAEADRSGLLGRPPLDWQTLLEEEPTPITDEQVEEPQ